MEDKNEEMTPELESRLEEMDKLTTMILEMMEGFDIDNASAACMMAYEMLVSEMAEAEEGASRVSRQLLILDTFNKNQHETYKELLELDRIGHLIN